MKAKERYAICDPAQPLTQFSGISEIPMIQMEQLRQLDFPITRGISYERTVDEFLLQLGTNDALRPLRAHKDMAILLNEEGALIREKDKWTLYFTPDDTEHLTLEQEADLYEILTALQAKHKKGDVCRVRLPERSLKTLVSGLTPFCILDEFCKNEPGGYLAVAKQIVLDGPENLFRKVPVCRYGALTTVDLDEIESYHTINGLLDDYIYACEHCAQNETVKPLSIAVFGAPGAGKSFGVKQIAMSRGRFHITSLNLSQFHDPTDMFQSLDQALRCEVGRIPLVFFDEFDAERNGVSRGWLKYFLAPMQDGEYTLDGKLCTIPGAVFVFAGATASSFTEFLPNTPEAETEFQLIKGPDFVSRLKGVLNIQGPNPTRVTDRRYMVRRALLLRSLLESAVPGIFDEPGGHANISPGLLSSLLRVSEYRHGSRSIELLIGMSRLTGVTRYTPSCLPVDAQLDIHLDVKDFRAKLAFEQIMGGRLTSMPRRPFPQLGGLAPAVPVAPSSGPVDVVGVALEDRAEPPTVLEPTLGRRLLEAPPQRGAELRPRPPARSRAGGLAPSQAAGPQWAWPHPRAPCPGGSSGAGLVDPGPPARAPRSRRLPCALGSHT